MISDERIQSYIDEGNYWRAKEVLQGRITNSGYSVELFRMLGEVLLIMHDTLNAGKYLFLSGVRKPEYSEAISLYLSRYSKKNIGHIFYTFPVGIRKISPDDYPEAVIHELDALGFTFPELRQLVERHVPDEAGGGAFAVGCLVLLLLGLPPNLLAFSYPLFSMGFPY